MFDDSTLKQNQLPNVPDLNTPAVPQISYVDPNMQSNPSLDNVNLPVVSSPTEINVNGQNNLFNPKSAIQQDVSSTTIIDKKPANVTSNYTNNISNNSLPMANNLNFSSSGDVLENDPVPKKNSASGLLKLLLMLILPVLVVGSITVFIFLNNRQKNYFKEQEVLLSVPMKNTNWKDIGDVFEPIIPVEIKTTNGYKKWEFLIDSGAVISSLPRDWAKKMGLDLALLRRSTFRGFGNSTSFAYHGEMTMRLGEKEFVIPVVFTEAVGTKSLLGRRGFFQDHSVYFNHIAKRIEIRN